MAALFAPVSLVGARARHRPGRWLAPAVGIALAAAFAGTVAAEGVIAGDRAAHRSLAALSPLDRNIRVTWQAVLSPTVAAEARSMLRGLDVRAPTEIALLAPVRLSGVVVRPAAISPLARWLGAPVAGRLGPCRADDCPVLLVGGGSAPPRLTAAGVRLRIVGSLPLRSAVPLGFAPATQGQQPVVVTGDVAGLATLAALSGVYRTYSWVGTPATGRFRSWQLRGFEDRLSRTQATLLASASHFSLVAPFAGLAAARTQASAAPRRLLLAGGGAIAVLALFVLLAGGGLRRDQLAELERLREAGAHEWQRLLFAVAECALICAVALAVGAVLAILSASVLARAAAEPAGGVLSHSLLTPAGALALGGGWVIAAAVMTVSALARSPRWIDALAVAAIAVLAATLSLGTGGQDRLAALVAPLCCLAAGVLIFRFMPALLRAGERAVRRGPVIGRLALVGIARSPTLPSLAIAFVAVTVGLGGFALSYRATLLRGAADQAADRVPLDALVAPGLSFKTPLQIAPAARWRALAGGPVLAVRRTDANYASTGGTVTEPALGVPAAGLARIHGWRESDGSAPLDVLARRLLPPGPVRTPGPRVPAATRWISVRASSPALAVTVTADLRDAQGAITQVPLGPWGAHAGVLRARVPGGRWELQAFELDEPTGILISNGHQNAESPVPATGSTARLMLGPMLALGATGRPLGTIDLGEWRAVGAALAAATRSRASVAVEFATTGQPGIIRPEQPSDTRPVPVLVDRQTAAAASPDGRLALTVDGLPVAARVVGVVRRFPTVSADAAGLVVADEATLASALDAMLPGQGRPDELWISTQQPARLKAALRTGALSQLSASFRADLERQLRSSPTAQGVLGTLTAAAALAAALAVIGLLTSMLGAGRDRPLEHDLEAQGIGPSGLRSHARVRVGLAALVGVLAGLAIATALTALAVASVRAAGTVSSPSPPLVTVLPWAELIAWGAAAALLLCGAGWVATRLLMPNRGFVKPEPTPASEGGAALSEELAR